MNEDQAPEVHEFFYGETDELAVQEYLNVKDDGEIARLAAMMAPKAKVFDPGALVDAAIALQTETKAGLIRRREAMVATMNYSTLLALQNKLGLSFSLYVDDNDESIHGPISSPVLRMIRLKVSDELKRSDELDNARIATDIEANLSNADARTTLLRPDLPCDLEQALRYAANSPRVPWPVLEIAFLDYIGLTNQAGQEKHEEKFQQKCMHDYSTALAELGGNAEDKSRRTELEAAVDRCRSKIADFQKARTFRKNFTPDQKIPTEISSEAAAIYRKHFQNQNPGCVNSEELLARLATEFHPFWQKHRDAYLSLDAAAEKARKAKVAKKREAGSKGPRTREEKKWTEHTVAFIGSIPGREAFLNRDALSQLVGNFARRRVKDPRTQKDLECFLGALCNAVCRDTDTGSIFEILKKSRVRAFKELTREEQKVKKEKMTDSDAKALLKGDIPKCFRCFASLTEEMIAKCLTLLKTALDNGS